MTKKQQRRFAWRFCLTDWQWLCSQMAFLRALDRTEAEAEVVAQGLLEQGRAE